MSRTRHSASQFAMPSRNSSADVNVWTRKPCASKRRSRLCNRLGLSSTSAMVRMTSNRWRLEDARLHTTKSGCNSSSSQSKPVGGLPDPCKGECCSTRCLAAMQYPTTSIVCLEFPTKAAAVTPLRPDARGEWSGGLSKCKMCNSYCLCENRHTVRNRYKPPE
jgi:hypothetical protein